jgi:hypothetical protein
MQDPRVNGSSQQVIGSSDGVDVPGQVQVELLSETQYLSICFPQPWQYSRTA